MSKPAKRTNRTPKKANKPARKRSAPDWAPRFLDCLGECGVIGYAAKHAGIGRTAVYERRDNDEVFARSMRTALINSKDVLVYEAVRRAKDGVRRPIYQGKAHVGYVRDYSDSLLMFLIKKRDPSYRDSVKVAHAAHDGGPLPETESVNVLERIATYTAAIACMAGGPAPGDASGDSAGKPVDPLGADGTAGPVPRPG